MIDASLLEMRSILYYRYIGSLTTPPCTQNVIWTIVKQVISFRALFFFFNIVRLFMLNAVFAFELNSLFCIF